MSGENKTGYLEVLVLGELEAASRTGYDLMTLLGKKLGSKPSPGSMYPLLNRMLSEKLISVKIEGRKKNYVLTSLGKKLLKEKMKEKEHSIAKNITLFRSMVRDNFCVKHNALNIMALVKVSRKVSPETARLLLELKEEMLNVFLSENYSEKEKELNKVVKEYTKIIKKMSESNLKTNSKSANKKRVSTK